MKLKELFISWSEFTIQRNLLFWIAHGLLIGHYWNHRILTWDKDFSGAKHNNCYLLEVNPNILRRALTSITMSSTRASSTPPLASMSSSLQSRITPRQNCFSAHRLILTKKSPCFHCNLPCFLECLFGFLTLFTKFFQENMGNSQCR